MKFAIVNEKGEFYPDPIYENREKGETKIAYLENYRLKNKIEWVEYTLEILTPKRAKQHEEEWSRWKSLID